MEIVDQYKPKFLKIMEGVSSRDTFSINPFSWELFQNFQLYMEIVEQYQPIFFFNYGFSINPIFWRL